MLAALHQEVSVRGQLWNSASGQQLGFHRFIQGHFMSFPEKKGNKPVSLESCLSILFYSYAVLQHRSSSVTP